jgi:hypothetical protein
MSDKSSLEIEKGNGVNHTDGRYDTSSFLVLRGQPIRPLSRFYRGGRQSQASGRAMRSAPVKELAEEIAESLQFGKLLELERLGYFVVALRISNSWDVDAILEKDGKFLSFSSGKAGGISEHQAITMILDVDRLGT